MNEKTTELTPEQYAEWREKNRGNNALMKRVRVKASAVVRQADGKIKYDNPDNIGKYHEDNLK